MFAQIERTAIIRASGVASVAATDGGLNTGLRGGQSFSWLKCRIDIFVGPFIDVLDSA